MAAHWGTSMVLSTWLLLSLSSCVHGTGEQIPGTDGWDVPPVSGGDCPFSLGTTFPPRVKVDMKVGSRSSAHLMTDSMKSRSMSPWEYSPNVDHNRFPVVINEARCLHHGCMDSEGNVDLSMNSVPIRQEVLVLRREMRECVPVYKLDKQLVTVGCTCVRPITHYLK
ncbi:interleukin-17A-like [Hyla sarda]|uniref:interleukin-17A-like n=1 Tax=Hyla sarda TaxID=327740 RepID=UPI0024C33A95|nr:interleukin-17A-like [Hyla sarda]XP_056419035.1 interleukin-17A-like [Hyla sarda]